MELIENKEEKKKSKAECAICGRLSLLEGDERTNEEIHREGGRRGGDVACRVCKKQAQGAPRPYMAGYSAIQSQSKEIDEFAFQNRLKSSSQMKELLAADRIHLEPRNKESPAKKMAKAKNTN